MEYIEGQDLRSLIAQQKVFHQRSGGNDAAGLPRPGSNPCGGRHSSGSQAAKHHARQTGRVVVMDFGLARLLDSDGGMTQTGAIVGTMEYMSPEQGLGQATDERSDLCRVGLIFYELLTGKIALQS